VAPLIERPAVIGSSTPKSLDGFWRPKLRVCFLCIYAPDSFFCPEKTADTIG
jgi:hypothetical protein